jgi:hypothetical protein
MAWYWIVAIAVGALIVGGLLVVMLVALAADAAMRRLW